MKILGLITEYNPFHNGHKHHLVKSIEETGATHTIVVMSGNFLQRGEPALTNKWVRAEMAVKEGVDLVLELPVAYACNSAEFFAYGAVSLLDHLQLVDFLSFGSEEGSMDGLTQISEILVKEPPEYQKVLKSHLSEGVTFPKARERALEEYTGSENLSSILHCPNNILGIEYIKSLMKINSNIQPHTIKRIKAPYNSVNIEDAICSATAIRAYLSNKVNPVDYLEKVMPRDSFKTLVNSMERGLSPVEARVFNQLLLYNLRTASKSSLKQILDVGEGLENRIKQASMKSTHYEDLLQLVKTKRYTQTRLQRIFIHSLLGMTGKHILRFNQSGGPQYGRVLAFSSAGAHLIKTLKKVSKIPILTNINKETLSTDLGKEMLSFDILATDIYSLGYPRVSNRMGSWDYYEKPYFPHNL